MNIKISLPNMTTLQGGKNTKQKIPFVEKPLVYHNLMFKQPEQQTNYGLFNFGNLFKTTYSEPKYETKTETQVVTKTEAQVVTKAETKVETKTATKVETASATKIKTKNKVKTEVTFDALKKSKLETAGLLLKDTAVLTSQIAAKTAVFTAKAIAIPFELSFKGIKMLGEKIGELKCEHDYVRRCKQLKIERLRKDFAFDLDKYRKLFEENEMKPDFAKYERYKTLSNNKLLQLRMALTSDIERQKELNLVKKVLREGADGYNGNRKGYINLKCSFEEVIPQRTEYHSCKDYQEELKRLCRIYIKNSKQFEVPLKDFDDITINFFAKNSRKLQEIYNIQNNKIIKLLERIPKIGIIPKGLRVFEQWNLANCITKDFRDVTEKHVYKGIHPAAGEYNEQYNTILIFAERHKNKFRRNNKIFTEEMLQLVEKCHKDRNKVYSILYDRFITGGCNIKKVCKKTKIRGGASLAKKAILTMMPFVC